MTLPIDPARINPDAYGEESVLLAMDHDTAVEVVRQICEEVGFGIPVEFSPSELLNEKVNADRDPYYVLGACNPAVANRALDESLQIGGLFPCNLVIWEEEPERQRVYHVSIMRIARLMGMVPDNAAWEQIIADTGELVDETFSRLRARDDCVESH